MLTYSLEDRGSTPLYEYLYRCIRRDILSGSLPASSRLPSKRALAEHLRVSVITVEGAYRQLEAEGYLYTLPRRGFFVSPLAHPPAPGRPAAIPAEPEAPVWRLDLGRNQADLSRFPAAIWARLTRQVLSEGNFLAPAPPQGLLALRQAIARDLRDFRGMAAAPEQIVVGAGAEYLYLLLAQLLGRDTVFAVEDPGYPKIRQVYASCGVDCRPVPLDRQGLDLRALAASGAGAAHISPAHHYPTGLVTPIGRRQALLRWAEETGGVIIEDDYDSEFRFTGRHISPAHHYPTGLVTPIGRRQALLRWAEETGGVIIEDDYDSEFRFTGRPIPTLQSIDQGERVVYLNTFSQTISPSMRVGFMVLPPRLLERYRRELGFYACTVPGLDQHVLARFLAGGAYEQHLARMRKEYRARRAAVIEAFQQSAFAHRISLSEEDAGLHFLLRLDTDLSARMRKEYRARRAAVIEAFQQSAFAHRISLSEEDAGLHFLLRLDTDLSAPELRRRADALGVRLAFLSDYAAAPVPAYAHTLVVNYAGLDPQHLEEAMALLAQVFAP